MMRRFKLLLVGAALAATALPAGPAPAMTCHSSIEDACRAAATVICKVVAKGRPCLM